MSIKNKVLSLIVAVIAILVTIFIYILQQNYTETKDKNTLANNTKIAICELNGIIHQKALKKQDEEIKEQFNRTFERIQNLDIKGVDDDLINFAIDVKAYYSYVKTIINTDIDTSEKEKLLKQGIYKFGEIFAKFNQLKKLLEERYNFKINC